jgi:hypothetical protein
MESALRLHGQPAPELSVRYLMKCNPEKWSCTGGGATPLGLAINPGVALESDVPEGEFSCDDIPTIRAVAAPLVGTLDPKGTPNREAIQFAIMTYGAVSTGIAATPGLQAYQGGLLACDQKAAVNHLVTLVGWDEEGGYWIARNSWGDKWGEDGYVRIPFGCNQIGSYASYVVITSEPVPHRRGE